MSGSQHNKPVDLNATTDKQKIFFLFSWSHQPPNQSQYELYIVVSDHEPETQSKERIDSEVNHRTKQFYGIYNSNITDLC